MSKGIYLNIFFVSVLLFHVLFYAMAKVTLLNHVYPSPLIIIILFS